MIHREKDIIQWAKDRGIIPGSTPAAQYSKTLSEWSEWKRDHTADDIGDTAVTLIIGCYLATEGALLLSDAVNNMPRVNIQSTNDAERLFECALDDIREEFLPEDYARAYQYLEGLAKLWGMSMTGCMETAWNDIKDRKGQMIHGLFVKEATLNHLCTMGVLPSSGRLESVCSTPEQRSRIAGAITSAGFNANSKYDKESNIWLLFSTGAL